MPTSRALHGSPRTQTRPAGPPSYSRSCRCEGILPQGPPLYFDHHILRKITLGDCTDDARDFGDRLHHVLNQLVDRGNGRFLFAGPVAHATALTDFTLLADDPDRRSSSRVAWSFNSDDLVEGIGDLRIQSIEVVSRSGREISVPKSLQRIENLAAISWRLVDVSALTEHPPHAVERAIKV